MDTVDRGTQFDASGYTDAQRDAGGLSPAPNLQPSTPYLRSTLPSVISGPDSIRQFYATGQSPQQRFLPSTSQTATAAVAPSQSQARQAALQVMSSLTLNNIPNTGLWGKVPADQLNPDGSVNLSTYQGLWSASQEYHAGDEVTYNGFLWQATDQNINSAPSGTNVDWERLAPSDLATYQGNWSSTTTYNIGDSVIYNNYLWQALGTSLNSAPAPGNPNWAQLAPATLSSYKGTWSSTTAYQPGDEVAYNNYLWQAINANTNSAPPSANWSQLAPVNLDSYKGTWSNTTAYNLGDEVGYAGNAYQCLIANTGQTPSSSSSYWFLLGPNTLDNVQDGLAFARVTNNSLLNNVPLRDSLNAILQFKPDHFWPLTCFNGVASYKDVGFSTANNMTGISWSYASNLALVPGDSGGALQLGKAASSTSGFVESSNTINFGNSWTVSLWVQAFTLPPSVGAVIVGVSSSIAPTTPPGAYGNLVVLASDGSIIFYHPSAGQLARTAPLNWNVSHFIGINYNTSGGTSTIGIVLDNQIVYSGSVAFSSAFGNLYLTIGGGYAGGSGWLYSQDLYVQDVAFYATAGIVPVSAAQFNTLYLSGSGGAQTLDNLTDGATYLRPVSVNGSHQTTTPTYQPNSISATYAAYTNTATVAVSATGNVVSTTVNSSNSVLYIIQFSATFEGTSLYVNIIVKAGGTTQATYTYPLSINTSIPITTPNTFWTGSGSNTIEIDVQNLGGGTATIGAAYLQIVSIKA